MNNRKILKKIKIQNIKGGLANPAPPIGPILGSVGVNIMDFCKQFNFKTQDKKGLFCPVIITVYDDKSFDFIIKTPSVASQILQILNLKKGSKEPNKIKVGKISLDQVNIIANNKMIDLNCFSLNSAVKMVIGTAKSMGIDLLK